jgi:hypothetical protein
MTVSCNPGAGAVNCVRWAQINLANASLGPSGSGTYGSNGVYRFFPDLAVNRCNDMAVGYTKSGSSMYPGIWVTGREHSSAAGTLQGEIQLKAGEKSYSAFDGSPYRWGDYTGMTVDPDGERFWYLGQYSKNIVAGANWGTYIGSFAYASCQSPPFVATDFAFLPLVRYEVAPPPPTTGPEPGFWEGGSVEFYVTSDRSNVDEFAIWINVPTCNIYGYKVTHSAAEPISNDAFSFSGSFYASGTFSSSTSASGLTGLNSYYIPGCGYVGSNGDWSWSATWSSTDASTTADIESSDAVGFEAMRVAP